MVAFLFESIDRNMVTSERTMRVRFTRFDRDKRAVSMVRQAVGTNGRVRHFSLDVEVGNKAVYRRLVRGVEQATLTNGTMLQVTIVQGVAVDHRCNFLADFEIVPQTSSDGDTVQSTPTSVPQADG